MNANACLEEFSITVQHIYDAAIDPNHWHEALVHMRHLVGASSASLLYSSNIKTVNTFPHFLFLSGYPESFIQALTPEYWDMWGLQSDITGWRVGVVQYLTDLMPREEFQNGRFYREVLQPYGQLDYMGMMALKEGPHSVHLNASTTEDVGLFSPDRIELMHFLAPHVCRAVRIGLALDIQTLQSKQFEATLNALSAGVFLVNQDGRIVFMNGAGGRLAKSHPGIGINNQRLILADEAAAAALSKCFAETGGNRAHEAASIAVPTKSANLVATVLPLDRGNRQYLTSAAYGAAFVVFLQDVATAPAPPGAAIAELYGLTPAELRVLLTIAQGHSAPSAAAILGVSLATAKTHVQHILHKTGNNRIADVVRLVYQASSPARLRQEL